MASVVSSLVTKSRKLVYLPGCGYRVAYTVLGAADAPDVVFYHHGFPSSSLEALFVAQAAKKEGLRLISVDRPGYGQSPFSRQHSFTGWPSVLLELANHLKVERFSLMGMSGGPAFAAACARLLPRERIVSLCLVAPEGPSAGFQLQALTPRACAAIAQVGSLLTLPLWLPARWVVKYALPAPVLGLLGWLAAHNPFRPAADRRAMSDGVSAICTVLTDSLGQGIVGSLHEFFLMYGARWGFDLEGIDCKQVLVFHGLKDVDVRLASAQCYLRIPGATAHYFPEAGHMSILPDHGGEIMRAVKAVHQGK